MDAERDGPAAGEAEEAEGKDGSRRGSSLDVQARDMLRWAALCSRPSMGDGLEYVIVRTRGAKL